MKMTRKGFTLVEIMIVVAIIGLLAAIAVPNFIQARAAAGRTGCLDQLGKFDSAAVTFWELDGAPLNNHVWPTSIGAMDTYFAGGTAPTTCPMDGAVGYTFTAATAAEPPYVSCPTHGSTAGRP